MELRIASRELVKFKSICDIMCEGGALSMAAKLDDHFTVANAVIVRLRLLRLRLTNVAQGGCEVIEVHETG